MVGDGDTNHNLFSFDLKQGTLRELNKQFIAGNECLPNLQLCCTVNRNISGRDIQDKLNTI